MSKCWTCGDSPLGMHKQVTERCYQCSGSGRRVNDVCFNCGGSGQTRGYKFVTCDVCHGVPDQNYNNPNIQNDGSGCSTRGCVIFIIILFVLFALFVFFKLFFNDLMSEIFTIEYKN